MWTYDQLSGALGKDGQRVATGYSGFGQGKNNPDMENVLDVGPIPGAFMASAHRTTRRRTVPMLWPSRRNPVPTLLAATDS